MTIPRHLAVIMDGNGRWAARRRRPRMIGHRAGARAVNLCIDFCLERGVEALTLFAFSSENWQRPATEVKALMQLFLNALDKEIDEVTFAARMALADLPPPDLFIRTGGDMRISNFLLWQLAYTELWFTDTLWPELDAATLARALDDFARRERRFGLTGEQAAALETPA
jgi:undecaprenyl pyrophosphate synthase